jgi:hypothetical protein
MIVWIVTHHYYDQYSQVVAVCAQESVARQYCAKETKDKDYTVDEFEWVGENDSFEIEGWEVGQ